MSSLSQVLDTFSAAPELDNKRISIKNLITFGMIDDRSIPQLDNFSSGIETKRGLKKVEKILQEIFEEGILNMFSVYREKLRSMNGILILDNIPEYGTVRETGEKEKIDVSHIHDTIYDYTLPEFILKMSNHTYVVFTGSSEMASHIANRLNRMFIDGEIIRAYSLKNQMNKKIVIAETPQEDKSPKQVATQGLTRVATQGLTRVATQGLTRVTPPTQVLYEFFYSPRALFIFSLLFAVFLLPSYASNM